MQSVGTRCSLHHGMVVSTRHDGTTFTEVGHVGHNNDPFVTQVVREKLTVNFPKQTTRFVRVVGVNPPTVMGLPGGGYVNGIFADEILID